MSECFSLKHIFTLTYCCLASHVMLCYTHAERTVISIEKLNALNHGYELVIELARSEEMSDLITSDPKVMMGKPVVAGTRITVEHILEELAAGSTIEELLESHPRLTREAVLAAIAYVLDMLRSMKAVS